MPPPRIDLGFCWIFGELPPEEGLSRLREAGFDGVELWPEALWRWGAERWAKALAASGLRCLQLCPYFDFVHGAAALEKSRLELDAFSRAARIVGCSRIRVFTGPPWGEGVVGGAEASPGQWEAATSSLRAFCDRGSAGVPPLEFCLECHEGSLMEDSPSARRLLDGVARPNLTINLQLPLLGEPWETSLAALAPMTTHIHIHNWTTGLGEGELTFLDEGGFDWEPVVRAIVERGRGDSLTLSVEHAGHGGRHDPWETARRDGAFLRELRARVLPRS
ncbi:Sugar phosphate isomerase/epimerase [Verrucomicrobium sp. GAS474]|uniref:sugar phosphate isomerase/epimerase family protein n=1 Tax=Verrucomicrobium sp. GAS474 TaxID=1882831 RepID=UPI00087C4175|nr:sugar phosphate isomerase/epimerase family protein [Verrucomicrobium sp. GAS474]SDT94383.1 Sugar phosphate isomerase/epimerase [Verrucomicrobium sp. GAS474]